MLIPLLLLLSSCLLGSEDILFQDDTHKIVLQDYSVYSSSTNGDFKVYIKKKHDDYSTDIIIHNKSSKPKRAKVRIYFTSGSGGEKLSESFPANEADGVRVEPNNILIIQVLSIRALAADMDSPKSLMEDVRK